MPEVFPMREHAGHDGFLDLIEAVFRHLDLEAPSRLCDPELPLTVSIRLSRHEALVTHSPLERPHWVRIEVNCDVEADSDEHLVHRYQALLRLHARLDPAQGLSFGVNERSETTLGQWLELNALDVEELMCRLESLSALVDELCTMQRQHADEESTLPAELPLEADAGNRVSGYRRQFVRLLKEYEGEHTDGDHDQLDLSDVPPGEALLLSATWNDVAVQLQHSCESKPEAAVVRCSLGPPEGLAVTRHLLEFQHELALRGDAIVSLDHDSSEAWLTQILPLNSASGSDLDGVIDTLCELAGDWHVSRMQLVGGESSGRGEVWNSPHIPML